MHVLTIGLVLSGFIFIIERTALTKLQTLSVYCTKQKQKIFVSDKAKKKYLYQIKYEVGLTAIFNRYFD